MIAGRRARPRTSTKSCFAGYLNTAGLPDPDLVIRTAGEMRLSNFLLWQAAYAEFYSTPVYWPDFDEAEIDRALRGLRPARAPLRRPQRRRPPTATRATASTPKRPDGRLLLVQRLDHRRHRHTADRRRDLGRRRPARRASWRSPSSSRCMEFAVARATLSRTPMARARGAGRGGAARGRAAPARSTCSARLSASSSVPPGSVHADRETRRRTLQDLALGRRVVALLRRPGVATSSCCARPPTAATGCSSPC